MADEAYYRWVNLGKPYTMAQPLADLVALFRAAGYTVYHYPDAGHQQADPAEDHTPYSETGWPITSKEWISHALDIMPTAGLPSLPNLARRIIADKKAGANGTQPIKYINWTEENGDCWHESWQPSYARKSSTDKGHIHISVRSDMDTSGVVVTSGWNPVEELMTVADDVWAYDVDPGAGSYSAKGALFVAFNRTGTIANVQMPALDAILKEIKAQVVANGQALSELKAAVAELTVLVGDLPQGVTGGVLHVSGDLTVS